MLKVFQKACKADNDQDVYDYIQRKEVDKDCRDSKHHQTAAMIAAANNSVKVLEILHNHDFGFLEDDVAGMTCLLHAAKNGHFEAFTFLTDKVESRQDFWAVNKIGDNILQLASSNGSVEVVRCILQKDVEFINSKNKYNCTPLHNAAFSDKIEVVKLLVQNGADANVKQSNGHTPLHTAASYGAYDVVKYLVDKTDKSILNNFKQTPLHLAAFKKHIGIVELLVKKGFSVNAPDKYFITPFMYAARNGFVNILRCMIESNGECVNFSCVGSLSALYQSVMKQKLPVVKYLVTNGAEIDAQNNEYEFTALHEACWIGNMEIVEYLVDKGADVTIKEKEGNTPISIAARKGHLEVVEFLLENENIDEGKTAEVANNIGNTPLMRAASKGHLDVVKILHEAGVNILSKNLEGHTAEDLARSAENRDVVRFLQSVRGKVC